MSMMSFGGYGVQGSDPNLGDKIAKLKAGKKSSNDQVTDFLERELGVDRRELPLHERAALERAAELLSEASKQHAVFDGNSMGLKGIQLYDTEHAAIACPACGVSDGWWVDVTGTTGTWCCESCAEDTPNMTVAPQTPQTITVNDQQGQDWHDWERVYAALVRKAETDGDPAYAFDIKRSHGPVELNVIKTKVAHKKPLDYPVGTLLRIERAVIRESGHQDNERHYVSVGGLFDDNGVTILETMTPMNDLTGWSVTEEL